MEVTTKRIRLLDILRGFAVLGTLGTNIWIFAYLGDLSYLLTIDHNEWWASFDDFIRLFVLFLVNGKMLGLLTIMFGVGLEMKYQQSLRRKAAWPGVYLWASLILLMEGLIHFVLVMEYDILMSYGVTAMIVAFIVKRGDRAIKRAMIGTGSFHVIMIVLILVSTVSANLQGANISLGNMEEIVQLYKEGSWLEQVQYRTNNFLWLRGEAIFTIPMNIFLFLLGVTLMRKGAFAPDQTGKMWRARMLKWGLAVGLPLNLLIFVPGGAFDFPVRYLFAPMLSLGYIGLIAWLVEKNQRYWLWQRLEQAGKMSLTCYVLQNILGTTLFYGWGLGLGGKVEGLAVIIIWLLIVVFQLTFASLWLRKFSLGPMETARKYVTRLIKM
ncbi:DUF418 domain-containing protein [Bacillus sp. FJAT-52991]|uniref:DUF418 domain-containing protein n=1 Tax=Bacillus kandeliae TaxID=3129297 RepID=A0ABZ2N6S2_9BACI